MTLATADAKSKRDNGDTDILLVLLRQFCAHSDLSAEIRAPRSTADSSGSREWLGPTLV
jgi:hypothetical protein